jgi:signal transduction histidine kinase
MARDLSVGGPRARLRAWRLRFGPRTADVVVLLIAATVSVLQLATDPPGSFPIGRTLSWVIVAATLPTLWWRRRWPLGVTLFGCLVFAFTNVALVALFGLSTLAIRRRDRVLAAASAVAYAVFVLQPVIYQHSDLGTQALGCFFLTATFVAFGAYVGARRDLVSSLRDRADRAEAERELRAEQAKLGERARIAQEMHDVLAHKVSLIALHAGGLELNPSAGPDQVERSAVLIRSTARQALEDLRDVLGVLRADESADGAQLAPQPKLSDVRRLVEASRAAGVSVDLVATGDAEDLCLAESASAAMLPEQLGRTAYRVVQEGLTNVHKHARGAAATVRLDGRRGRQLSVAVSNLRPVSAGSLLPGSGAGLVGLRERVELAGGTLRGEPTAEGGWLLRAELPWPVTAVALAADESVPTT